jgi:phosphoheptose isomerase
MTVVGLSGFGGGKLSELADISVVVDSSDYGPVEDAHMMIIHLITRLLQTLEMPVSG